MGNHFSNPTEEEAEITVPDTHVLVLGCGNFGTCLADHLADMGSKVIVYSRNKEVADSINQKNINSKYLSRFKLSDSLSAVCELNQEIFEKVSVILMAIPTQHARTFLENIKHWITPSHLLIFVNKGIEISSGLLPSEVAIETLGKELGENATFLSVNRQPTAVTVASKNIHRARRTQRLFHAPHFRVYDVEDTTGVEIAGALKNVIAIASGASTGAGFQMNTRAAIITRGLAEITRFGVALGANPLTFSGLAGVGDLFLTATSEKSRNFTVGYRIGKGEKLQDIVASLGSVAEGVATAKAAYNLAKKKNIDAPITEAVYLVLYEDLPVDQAIKMLSGREAHAELRGIA